MYVNKKTENMEGKKHSSQYISPKINPLDEFPWNLELLIDAEICQN